MDRLDELATAEHELRDQVADAKTALERADMCCRAARAKRRVQLLAEKFFASHQQPTGRQLDGQVDIEITEGEGDVAVAWQAWISAKANVAKLEAAAEHARSNYFDYRETQRRGG